MFVTVKNLNGSGEKKCKCGSWLAHWSNFAKEQPFFCANLDCKLEAKDGAHVKRTNPNDNSHYIVPLCHACNTDRDAEFTVMASMLASANVAATCEKFTGLGLLDALSKRPQ
jgi:hypothetical protein